ncbi:Uu.00g096590.m01.CDS01 [Anthostomella pinea]|uniref:Uu.00g096590.m01.CDS01 n=1 Tax=Anthostomella pinea TaxID=933095 RepID=A0AAI8VC81_9PEZI|nr:Uu.00g096590.m01.CDS01 [Anthostomella pinea]
MATAEIARSASPAEPTTSKKRKSSVDEIEVDLELPEPPSKKAKRLLKKGKPLPVKPDSDAENDEDGLPIAKGGKKEKNKRSDHGVWIGNLPFTVTRVELFRWLVEGSGGVIKEENITRVNLPMSKAPRDRRGEGGEEKPKPQNRGFAYVDFDVAAAAVAAMALTETEIDGRKVLIKNSNSFEGRPAKESSQATAENGDGATDAAAAAAAAAAAKKNTSRKIYVGNLSFQTNENDLWAQFEKCGEIEWSKVATFEDSGKCKGFGWVKFKDAEAAEWAVKGFVKIKEEIETEDDFRDDAEADADGDGQEKQERKFKMRKWWVNRLRGRELKIAFAEDDQVRYRKRFGKDRPDRPERPQRNGEGRQPAATSGEDGNAAVEKRAPKKKPTYGDENVASYLTGAVVKSEGKKTTFD